MHPQGNPGMVTSRPVTASPWSAGTTPTKEAVGTGNQAQHVPLPLHPAPSPTSAPAAKLGPAHPMQQLPLPPGQDRERGLL